MTEYSCVLSNQENIICHRGKRLIVAGGDTSAAVCHALGVKGMRVWKEIEPGLPSCVTLGESPYVMVLKSGSFGREDFLWRSIGHLNHCM